MVVSLDVTRRILTLGAQDPTTGWYSKDYSTTATIEMLILRQGQTLITSPIGLHARHNYTGFTDDTVAEGDEILDARSNYYQINTRTEIPLGDSLFCVDCELEYDAMHADRPATSGTWILESALNLDPRYRHKVLLDPALGGYLVANNMKKDDNATNASFIVTFGMCDYPIRQIFITKAVDLIFCIESATTTQTRGYDKTPTHNIHDVTISLWTINKADITAARLLRAAGHELERIMETYPTGSLRGIGREDPEQVPIGSTQVWQKKYVMHYEVGISG